MRRYLVGPRPTHRRAFYITFSTSHLVKTPLDEGSARLRYLYHTTFTTDKKKTPPTRFEPVFPNNRSAVNPHHRPRGHWDQRYLAVKEMLQTVPEFPYTSKYCKTVDNLIQFQSLSVAYFPSTFLLPVGTAMSPAVPLLPSPLTMFRLVLSTIPSPDNTQYRLTTGARRNGLDRPL